MNLPISKTFAKKGFSALALGFLNENPPILVQEKDIKLVLIGSGSLNEFKALIKYQAERSIQVKQATERSSIPHPTQIYDRFYF